MVLPAWAIVLIVLGAIALFVVFAILIFFLLRYCFFRRKKDSKKKSKLKLKASDLNPEEAYFTAGQIKKKGPCEVQKQLMTPENNETLPNDKVKIQQERRLQFSLGEYYEVGDEIEKVVDQDGNTVEASIRNNTEEEESL